jgi:hypothetical protein
MPPISLINFSIKRSLRLPRKSSSKRFIDVLLYTATIHPSIWHQNDLIVRGSSAPKTPLLLNNSLFICVPLCQKIYCWHSSSLLISHLLTNQHSPTPLHHPNTTINWCDSNSNAVFLYCGRDRTKAMALMEVWREWQQWRQCHP